MKGTRGISLALACVWLGSSGCERSGNNQGFDVRGIVRGVDTSEGTLRIEHEEIPNYMPAMTMSLPVKRRELLQGLQPGDAIRLRLEVSKDDSWISRIEKVAAGAPAGGSISNSAPAASRVQAGEKVPEFTVIDQHGRARSLSDFRGKSVIVNFIYTRCPLPNFCPLLSSKIAELQRELNTHAPGKFHLVSITIDPEHDTPDVLKRYAATWSKDDQTWTFGVAAPNGLAQIASSFGLVYERNAAGAIDHDLRTALIDPQGRLVHVWRSNFWKPAEVLDRMRGL